MFFGTAVAVIWAAVFGYSDPVVLIAPALTASLVSIVNVPIAAIFIVVELFGADWLVPSLFMLVVVSIVTHENSIYRTQHDSFDSSEVLPGIVVRDLDVPARLVGQSLQDIDIRKRFGLTVVGIRDNSIEGAVELNPAPDRVLAAGEELVVLGDPDGFARWSQSAADADG